MAAAGETRDGFIASAACGSSRVKLRRGPRAPHSAQTSRPRAWKLKHREATTRSRISRAALLVKVTAAICCAAYPLPVRRWAMTVVLPRPAPTKTRSGRPPLGVTVRSGPAGIPWAAAYKVCRTADPREKRVFVGVLHALCGSRGAVTGKRRPGLGWAMLEATKDIHATAVTVLTR